MDDLGVRRVSTFDGFQDLRSEWERLDGQARLDSVFLTHAWLSAWWQVYGAAHALFVLDVQSAGETVGIVPLTIRQGRVRRVTFMGAGKIMPNHLDVLALPGREHAVAAAGWAYLREHCDEWDLVDLTDIAAGSPLVQAIEREAGAEGIQFRKQVSSLAPYAALPASFDAYLNLRGATTRKHLQYYRRRLSRDLPGAQFCRVSTPAELDRVFEALVRLHQARWTARGEPGSFKRPGFTEFHTLAAHAGLRDGTLRMYYLLVRDDNLVGDAIAGVFYCYRTGERVCYYLSGFDDQLNKYSPGTLLLAHALEQSIAEGAREFDFLQGDEGYKEHWATGSRENCRVLIAGPHLRGRLAFARDESITAGRALARRIVPRSTARSLRHLLQK